MSENGEQNRSREPGPNEISGEWPQARRFQARTGVRRRRLHLLTAALIALASVCSLLGGRPERPVDPDARPPLTGATRFSYRHDGGQIASPEGILPPNALTSLNLGRSINLKSSQPAHLAHLPSLGPNSAAKAVASGCLSSRQRKTLDELITESCNPNNL